MYRMLLGKAPLRLSMGGGGTDIESFYSQEGGYWTSAAISLYVRISVNRRWSKSWIVKYSDQVQMVDDLGLIKHNILRESLLFLKADDWLKGKGMEINIMSDVPRSSGLGVSGAITVNLLQILHAMKGDNLPRKELAEEAYYVEHDLCGSVATGKQDQYIAAFGGITSFEVTRKGYVEVYPLELDSRTQMEINENLVLFGTGIGRPKSADETLREQGLASKKEGLSKVDYLKKIKEIGLSQQEALLSGNVRRFGELLDEHWETKKQYSDHTANPAIDNVYEDARKAGALGGKVVGAGTIGAYWLFYVEGDKKSALRDELAKKHGLEEVPWNFVEHGSMIAYCE